MRTILSSIFLEIGGAVRRVGPHRGAVTDDSGNPIENAMRGVDYRWELIGGLF
jgi:hypothetical protein